MNLPSSPYLPINRLSQIFNKTVATYKFYWFISILEIYSEKNNPRINLWDIIIRMVANAWYPINYFKLSFGKSDSMYDVVKELRNITNIPIDTDKKEIISILEQEIKCNKVKNLLRIFTLNVPFRFLRPWIDTSDDKETVERSTHFENSCLYAIQRESNNWWIDINPVWSEYLTTNCKILLDFSYWNLALFLQTRNPNVPNIPNKLIKPDLRASLNNQRKFWNTVVTVEGNFRCIYTNKELQVGEYDLDHFIPWSFVSHDLLWNLVPVSPEINSSKSDGLPDLKIYLPKLADSQHKALKTFTSVSKSNKILEDYLSLGSSIDELIEMDDKSFYKVFEKTFSPLEQIALNMGFKIWKRI